MTGPLDLMVYHAPMSSRADVRKLADIRPRQRCPKCSQPNIKRRASAETHDDERIYYLTEKCSCGWSRELYHIKAV